ncbi:MAG: Nif3-like dinuclear metal center hexameric protein [Gemmatimonadales bacterium]
MTHQTVPLAEITEYLDGYLRTRDVPDDPSALNGLQVENAGRVGCIIAAVDASQATIDGLRGNTEGLNAPTSPLLIVHHGLFWDGNLPVTGRRYRRLRALLAQDAALYSAHIPLDVHPEVGNNQVLARRLGLNDLAPFGHHKGIQIGIAGTAPPTIRTRDALVAALAGTLGVTAAAIKVIAGGPEQLNRIGVITGGAGSAILQARDAGCDTFITGEGAAHTYFDAMEGGITVLYAGHYATETVGVQALAAHLSTRFHLPWAFHDHPTGL